MKRDSPDYFVYAGLLALGILIGLLAYQNLFPPRIVERVYFQGDNGTVTVTTRPLPFTETYYARMPVLAVKSDDNTGVVSYVNIEIRAGKGRVLINTNPFVEPDTQYSAETAIRIAGKLSAISLTDMDVILTFEANTTLVGGPSAGAAMTLATLAALQNKKLPQTLAITGTIEEDGTIGGVGGVLEKAEAAAKSGVKTFLVPSGGTNLVYYERKITERRAGPFVIQEVNYIPRSLNLTKYADEKWGIEVTEVADINEAKKYFGL